MFGELIFLRKWCMNRILAGWVKCLPRPVCEKLRTVWKHFLNIVFWKFLVLVTFQYVSTEMHLGLPVVKTGTDEHVGKLSKWALTIGKLQEIILKEYFRHHLQNLQHLTTPNMLRPKNKRMNMLSYSAVQHVRGYHLIHMHMISHNN